MTVVGGQGGRDGHPYAVEGEEKEEEKRSWPLKKK